ncbi:MAG: MarC family protein [Gammaproteobacteria bacterium]|nr:MarC family protein [Gammaproteobacteria bacterium]MDH3370215.1 MarC family protein [Gammaproteobacteria bacterium]MDH3405320.1 MarC family protein [Gammaproteobacteria bacterium]MDH3561780.1 MarC family protein [Gammaproteobacteria bacterium]MDH5485894.1 MarC family protein [Gammaproteobacteria bacterium]
MFDLFVDSLIIMLVVVDPVGIAPLFVALTQGESEAARRRTAFRGTLIAGGILVVFVLVGDSLLNALGIGMPAFQIAGGALLFLLAVEMVFARHSGVRSTTAREQREAETRKDISVFPLAIPLIAGPGALTSVLLMVGEQGDDPLVIGSVLAVIVVVLLITLASLLFSARIMAFMGETGANVVSRVLGVILAALAVQFVLNGWQEGFLLLQESASPGLSI